MRKIIALIFVLWSPLAFAGYIDRGAVIDEYDPATGYYYLSWISDKRVTNLFVFDPKKNSGEMIFRDEAVYRISDIIYESGYNQKERMIEFGGEQSSYTLKNNNNIPRRVPKNKLLIVTTKKKTKASVLWTADKSGTNLKKILTVDFRDDWHLDVQNSKIRVVKKDKDKNTLLITQIDW